MYTETILVHLQLFFDKTDHRPAIDFKPLSHLVQKICAKYPCQMWQNRIRINDPVLQQRIDRDPTTQLLTPLQQHLTQPTSSAPSGPARLSIHHSAPTTSRRVLSSRRMPSPMCVSGTGCIMMNTILVAIVLDQTNRQPRYLCMRRGCDVDE